VAFPKSISSELAANLPRHACRTGESITMSSKRNWLNLGIASFEWKLGLAFMFLLFSATSFAATTGGGACPANAPVKGNNCFFISAGGSDSNNGTSESTSWLHSPGMTNCSGTCAAVTPTAGQGFIFRGGDSWHTGNSGASPYVGGPLNWQWSGTTSACAYEGTQTGCVYVGVDTTWYNSANCSSWCRPILNADNPTSKSIVSTCAYQTASTTNPGVKNSVFVIGNNVVAIYIDSFELTGLCGNSSGTPGNDNTYITGTNTGQSGNGMNFLNNIYIHGWTTTSLVNNDSTVCTMLGGGNNGLSSITQLAIDGSDSNGSGCTWGQYPSWYHLKDSIVRYATDGVGQWCHDIHDNIFEYIVPVPTGGHTNILECNQDSTGNAPNQPANTPNVVYNNIVRHSDSNVDFWFCPTAIPEYWFNNLMYDTEGEGWAIAGPPGYSGCPNTGGQFMFNNTLVDGSTGGWTQPCHLTGSNNTGGAYLTVYNEHLINTPYDGTGCTGGASSSTNISMSDATATTQGYTAGSPGTYLSNTCANESTQPCTPTAQTNSTVGTAANHQDYCSTLASYSSEYAIGTEAANSCRYGTTDGCAYNSTSHTMVCPSQQAIARAVTGAWNAGGYEYASGSNPPNPPTGLTAVVQ
jgi:hypothetical protein